MRKPTTFEVLRRVLDYFDDVANKSQQVSNKFQTILGKLLRSLRKFRKHYFFKKKFENRPRRDENIP